MTYIRKMMAAFWGLGLAVAVTSVSHAFQSQGTVASTASVTVAGGAASMSVSIRNVSNNNVASAIGWTGVNAGSSWTLADQYLQIASTLTSAGAGIQTYTDNTVAGASPRYTGAVSSTAAAGLVNASDTLQTLPLAWQIRGQGAPIEAVDDPNNIGGTGWAWFYYADRAGGLMANAPGNFYVQPLRAGSPSQIQFAQTSFGAGAANSVNNLYLEANFQNALGGNTYATSRLTVELFIP